MLQRALAGTVVKVWLVVLTKAYFGRDFPQLIVQQQRDIQYFRRMMLDALEKQSKKDGYESIKDLISELYQGSMKDYVKCLEVDRMLDVKM